MDDESEKLKEKVRFYESILNQTSGLIFLTNTSNKMLWTNQRYFQLLGHTHEYVNQLGIVDYVKKELHPDDVNVYANSIEHLSNKELSQSLSIYRQKDANGNWRKILVSGKTTRWKNDETPEEVVTVGIDITDQFAEFTDFEKLLKENIYLKNKLKLNSLTKREIEILTLISEGNSTKEIAELKNISFHTAEWHRKNISRKLGIHKSSELVRFAVESGL